MEKDSVTQFSPRQLDEHGFQASLAHRHIAQVIARSLDDLRQKPATAIGEDAAAGP